MTNYSLEIRNRLSRIQFDGNYINYYLKESGLNAHIVNSNDDVGTQINFSGTYHISKAPLFAFRITADEKWVTAHRYYVDANNKITGIAVNTLYDDDCYIDWRLYVLDYPTETDDYGILFKNDKGQKIYTSSEEALKTVDPSRNLGALDFIVTNYNISHDEINPYYILQPYGWLWANLVITHALSWSGIMRKGESQIWVSWGNIIQTSAGPAANLTNCPNLFLGIVPAK